MASQTNGICSYCQKTLGRQAMKNHVLKCCNTNGTAQDYFCIYVRDEYLTDYWMYLSVSANTTLARLDGFLREIWLECCGHMSSFEINDTFYKSNPDDWLYEKDMSSKLSSLLSVDTVFSHMYDFGSTTDLVLNVSGIYKDAKRRDAVQLMARNVPPDLKCVDCGSDAVCICTECWTDSGKCFLCSKCAVNHQCGQDCQMPIVNSPRTGICAYCG